MNITEQVVVNTILVLLNMTKRKINCEAAIHRIYKNHFGFDARVILLVWQLLHDKCKETIPHKLCVKHLLWMFSYFETYCEYKQNSTRYNCSLVTFCTRVWYSAKLIAKLEIVRLLVPGISIINYIHICTHFCIQLDFDTGL
jgi:hypothetical protein